VIAPALRGSPITALAFLTLAGFTGCQNQPAISSHPHYVLGRPYQAAGAWHYPAESYDLDETGVAGTVADGHPALTTNGEAFDQTAMAAAHATLQLPAIARVTNLETGRSVLVRINDRGSGTPHRIIELTRRVAVLLGLPDSGIARVRVQVRPAQSHAAVDVLPDAPRLAMATAPRSPVEVAELPSLPGVQSGRGHALARAHARIVDMSADVVPLRLPETVTQVPADPGKLWVRLDSFEEYQFAATLLARVPGFGAHIVPVPNGRRHTFIVEVGPLDDVRQADSILDQALAAGIPDARIVVE
jgi:rare lipoprotein A